MVDQTIWQWIKEILECPDCRGLLSSKIIQNHLEIECIQCGRKFTENHDTHLLDLRCQNGKRHTNTSFVTGNTDFESIWNSIKKGLPEITYSGSITPRTSRAFLSVIKDRVPANGIVLDIGCGAGEYRPLVKGLGKRYLGIDYSNKGSDMLCDAHALPFQSNSIDAIIMYGVLQALENPFVACSEFHRVLKRDGLLISSSDCGALFIDSFFNITPWGIISVFYPQGFEIERMWIIKDALVYFATNSGYPRIVRFILKYFFKIASIKILAPRRFLSKRTGYEFITAGSFGFIAKKL